jgi:hypothetical protein
LPPCSLVPALPTLVVLALLFGPKVVSVPPCGESLEVTARAGDESWESRLTFPSAEKVSSTALGGEMVTFR